jgi:hypothetical protein
MYFISIYENRRMKPADIALRKGEGGKGRTTEGVNLTKVYCKDIGKYYDISSCTTILC